MTDRRDSSPTLPDRPDLPGTIGSDAWSRPARATADIQTTQVLTDDGRARIPFSTRPKGRAWPERGRLVLQVLGVTTITAWLGGLLVYSTSLYRHHYLSTDFAFYNQAWSQIGQGHLDPYSTIWAHRPVVKWDFELILWPLGLVHLIYGQPVVLLWVQDVAVAACGLVVYLWITDYLHTKRVAWSVAVVVSLVVLAVIVVNPGVYGTLVFDVHMEPISTVFVLLAGRDIWQGRSRRAWVWIAVALTCGTFAAVTVIGLGVSAVLAGASTRRQGTAVIAVAVAWLALISVLGADQGAVLSSYAYLAGRRTISGPTGVAVIVAGILGHPARAIHVIGSRLHDLWVLIKPAGVVGLASAWGFGVPVVVMLVNVLNHSDNDILMSYQNFAVAPFLLLGTVMVLVWLAQRFRLGWIPAIALALALAAQSLAYGATTSPGTLHWGLARVTTSEAAALSEALARTPPQAEVIATIEIMGRFAGRKAIYSPDPGSTRPVIARPVVFVIDPAIDNFNSDPTPADDRAMITYVRDVLGARVLLDRAGVVALEWQPPPATRRVAFPTPSRHPSSAAKG